MDQDKEIADGTDGDTDWRPALRWPLGSIIPRAADHEVESIVRGVCREGEECKQKTKREYKNQEE